MGESQDVQPAKESSGGFKSFWRKKTSGAARGRDLTFVQQDPSTSKKSGGSSRLGLKSDSDNSASASPGPRDAVKRRQQVYDAQKRHRDRKSEYIRSLEAEVARLQHMEAAVSGQRAQLARQNRAMRNILGPEALDVGMGRMDLTSSESAASESLSPAGATDGASNLSGGGAAVDIRWDELMKHERTFIDLDEMNWTPTGTTSSGNMGDGEAAASSAESQNAADTAGTHTPRQRSPVAGDSWTALDFILALEWPCRDHVHHSIINPSPPAAETASCEPAEMHGHALTTTAAVYNCAQPAPASQTPGEAAKWHLPHSEIDKLVELSQNLELDEELMTPAQVYSAVRGHLTDEAQLRPVLGELKESLGLHMRCQRFGACVETDIFWQHLQPILQAYNVAGP